MARAFRSFGQEGLMLLFPDAYRCDTRRLLDVFSEGVRGVPVVGGGAGEAGNLGGTLQFSQTEVRGDAVSGMILSGGARFQIGVTQGCRPFAGPYRPTRVQGNRILELDGRPATLVASEAVETLKARSHGMARGPIFLGFDRRNTPEAIGREDYRVRHIVGVDRKEGGITVAEGAGQLRLPRSRRGHGGSLPYAGILEEDPARAGLRHLLRLLREGRVLLWVSQL